MKLRDYMDSEDISNAWLGEVAKVSHAQISRVKTGASCASLGLVLRLLWLSDGLVEPSDLPISAETRATLALIRDLVREGETFE